jgi:hypothetical protein
MPETMPTAKIKVAKLSFQRSLSQIREQICFAFWGETDNARRVGKILQLNKLILEHPSWFTVEVTHEIILLGTTLAECPAESKASPWRREIYNVTTSPGFGMSTTGPTGVLHSVVDSVGYPILSNEGFNAG